MRLSEQFLELVSVLKETCRNFIRGRLKLKTIGAYTESTERLFKTQIELSEAVHHEREISNAGR